MEPITIEKSSFNHKYLSNKYDDDENEQKLQDFLSSKLEAMEKINLCDDFFIEGEAEIKKDNLDKNDLKIRKSSNSPKKKIKTIHSKKKNESKKNNKNMIINHNGEIEKLKMESKDLVGVVNLNVVKEIKNTKLDQFFSNQNLLISIISEMKGKQINVKISVYLIMQKLYINENNNINLKIIINKMQINVLLKFKKEIIYKVIKILKDIIQIYGFLYNFDLNADIFLQVFILKLVLYFKYNFY